MYLFNSTDDEVIAVINKIDKKWKLEGRINGFHKTNISTARAVLALGGGCRCGLIWCYIYKPVKAFFRSAA